MFGKRCYDMPKQGGCSSCNRDIYQNIDIEQNYSQVNANTGNMYSAQAQSMSMGGGCGCMSQPIVEQPIIKCVHRTFNHTVPQE